MDKIYDIKYLENFMKICDLLLDKKFVGIEKHDNFFRIKFIAGEKTAFIDSECLLRLFYEEKLIATSYGDKHKALIEFDKNSPVIQFRHIGDFDFEIVLEDSIRIQFIAVNSDKTNWRIYCEN